MPIMIKLLQDIVVKKVVMILVNWAIKQTTNKVDDQLAVIIDEYWQPKDPTKKVD